jgi:rubrerythrin
VGVGVDESASAPRSATETRPATETEFDDPGFTEFVAAGAQVDGEYRCADCGYGAVVHSRLPVCPMCGGAVWERRGPLPGRLID